LDAARRVFLDRGYGGATVDAIAEEAGFSKGGVYSQFGSKADMFMALLERRITERAAEKERVAAGKSPSEAAREPLLAAHPGGGGGERGGVGAAVGGSRRPRRPRPRPHPPVRGGAPAHGRAPRRAGRGTP